MHFFDGDFLAVPPHMSEVDGAKSALSSDPVDFVLGLGVGFIVGLGGNFPGHFVGLCF